MDGHAAFFCQVKFELIRMFCARVNHMAERDPFGRGSLSPQHSAAASSATARFRPFLSVRSGIQKIPVTSRPVMC